MWAWIFYRVFCSTGILRRCTEKLLCTGRAWTSDLHITIQILYQWATGSFQTVLSFKTTFSTWHLRSFPSRCCWHPCWCTHALASVSAVVSSIVAGFVALWMLQHDVHAVAFFPCSLWKSLPESSGSSGSRSSAFPNAGKVFWSPECDLLHPPMPENSGPQARYPSRDQIFMAWRNVKCLIPGTGRLFQHLWTQKVSFQGPEKFSDMGECKKDIWVAGKMSWYQQREGS